MYITNINNNSPNFGMITRVKIKGSDLRKGLCKTSTDTPITQQLLNAIADSKQFRYPGRSVTAVIHSRDFDSFPDQFATGVTSADIDNEAKAAPDISRPRYKVEISIFDKTKNSGLKNILGELKYYYRKIFLTKEDLNRSPEVMLSYGSNFDDVVKNMIHGIENGDKPHKFVPPTYRNKQ